jgi:hypothetical protein
MVAVRYAALAALVVWIGGMLTVVVGDALTRFSTSLACGGVVLLSLLVLKFVGPPPRAFVPRVALVAVMIVATILAATARLAAPTAAAVNLAIAAVLLIWYLYE